MFSEVCLSSFPGLDDLHLFDGYAQGLLHVAEVGHIAESRLTFGSGERLFHGLLALEVELGEPTRKVARFLRGPPARGSERSP